jgi:hypothetical protein
MLTYVKLITQQQNNLRHVIWSFVTLIPREKDPYEKPVRIFRLRA